MPLLPGHGDAFGPWGPTGFFRHFALLIYFIIHNTLTERRGGRFLFYSERGDVAINAVTATCTCGKCFFPPRLPYGPDCGIVSPLWCYLWSNCAYGVFNWHLAVLRTYRKQQH